MPETLLQGRVDLLGSRFVRADGAASESGDMRKMSAALRTFGAKTASAPEPMKRNASATR